MEPKDPKSTKSETNIKKENSERLIDGLKAIPLEQRLDLYGKWRESGLNISQLIINELQEDDECMCDRLRNEKKEGQEHKEGCPFYYR